MSGSPERGPGRPPGLDPDTLDRIRRVKEHERLGRTRAEIAALEGVSLPYIKLLLRMPTDAPVRPRKPPPVRLTERALAHHAVLAMRRDTRLRAFDPAKKLFWLDAVMEIHALGDDGGLSFGRDGDPFETHAEFAAALGGKPDDLEHFLRRGLLTRLPDYRIDLPARIGLKPKERPRAALPGSGEQPLAQPFDVAGGGRADSEMGGDFTIQRDREMDSEIPEFHYPADSETPSISLSGAGLARAADADADAKGFQSLSISISKEGRARDGDSEIPEFHYPRDSEKGGDFTIPADREKGGDSEIESKRSEAADLTQGLMGLAGIRRAANPADLGTVQGWLADGFTGDEIRAAIAVKERQRNGQPPVSLRYFDKPLREAREARSAAPVTAAPPPPATAAAPEPDEPDEPDEMMDGPGIEDQLRRVKRGMRQAIGKADWKVWMKHLVGARAPDDEGELTLLFDKSYPRDHVRQRFDDALQRLWQAENPAVVRLRYEVAQRA